jgi:hypothetical protein
MPLDTPNLDDRDFDQLMAEAQLVIEKSCPAWSNRSPSDPGMVLLETFAYLTETMIYRLNRLPEKAYIEFLRLIGLCLQPPSAASVDLSFSVSQPTAAAIEIPRGTRVTASRSAEGEPIVFTTALVGKIEAGATETQILAIHCDVVEGELVGSGTGRSGLSLTVSRPPIVAPTGEELDLVVGVEIAPNEPSERRDVRHFKGKTYRIWREVESFANLDQGAHVYLTDRVAGRITFAPAARQIDERGFLEETPRQLAGIPPANREIRVWYRRGGGPNGNVAAETLTVLKDPIAGLQVSNRKAAIGGRAAETLENALIRGPQELHSLERVVTARDIELVALRSSGAIARATAFTEKSLWTYAQPGTVRVLLVPSVPEAGREPARIKRARLHECESPLALQRTQEALDERRPLGTICRVSWVRYKTVRVSMRVVAHVDEHLDVLKNRLLSRLYMSISPLPVQGNAGWRFGEALRVSNVYDVVLSEPGVSYVDEISLAVDDVPERDVSCLAADFHQPHSWYAGSGGLLFRSVDDGDGWETVGRFPDEAVSAVSAHPERAGVLAVATRLPTESEGSRVRVSRNCGESWELAAETAFAIAAMAWTMRDDTPLLLLATSAGLYELAMLPQASPVQVFVDQGDQGFYSVVAARDLRGWTNVAVAARGNGGVYYSWQEGRSHTFRDVGLRDQDVRVLAIEREGLRSFLWGGMATDVAGGTGKGCVSLELQGEDSSSDGWQPAREGWDGGSCRSLGVQGGKILAGSHHKGVLQLTPRQANAAWELPTIHSGLPLRESETDRLFYPVVALAASPQGELVMGGGRMGIYRSAGALGPYTYCSSRTFADKVTLPPTWLFCSGDHAIDMVYEHGAG